MKDSRSSNCALLYNGGIYAILLLIDPCLNYGHLIEVSSNPAGLRSSTLPHFLVGGIIHRLAEPDIIFLIKYGVTFKNFISNSETCGPKNIFIN